jgi:hypothetical protein
VASSLKWRAGFGWGALSLFATATVLALFTAGPVRTAATVLGLLALVFIAYQWRKWNKRGWQQVHYRAMLVYATIVGRERATAQHEKRSFSKVNACRSLARAVVGSGCEANADAMINALIQERGGYFTHLVETFGETACPKLDPEVLRVIAEKIGELDFGPELVIGNIVENTYGGEEAARYVVALVTGKAK